MADVVATVSLEYLLKNLISMLSEEIKLVHGFEDELSKLKQSLIDAQEFLSDAEAKEIKERDVKKWLKNLEDVAFEADDVLDEFNYHLVQNKLKKEKQKVPCFSSSSSTSLPFRREIALKINDLNIKFNKINENATSKELKKNVVNAPDASTVGLADHQTNSYATESKIIGRESDVAEIVEMVLTAPFEEKVSVLPIVGMGGLGKTTLTRKVYHHEKIKSRFDKKIWICVSFNFDELTLFQNIYSTLAEESVQLHDTAEFVLQKIRKFLENKRYLMILDDVWNEDYKKWDDFMKSLIGISNSTQNVIIVTTRLEHVASRVKTLTLYKLASLSDIDCWSIIKAKATNTSKDLSNIDNQEYEEIGKQFAQKCRGLPLAATVIGGLLFDKSKEEWFSILTNELSNLGRDDDDNDIKKILRVSYNRLPSSLLKKCFVYCSIFPQDFKINKKTLIEQWLGEGFLKTNQENDSMEAIGNKIINQLMHASLFQECERDDLGNITHCQMHDFVHDLACSISRGGTAENSGNDMNKVRYMHLQRDEPCQLSKEQTKYLRTLIVDGVVADNMFPGGYSHLRVLTFKNSRVDDLPFKLEKQVNIRFLDISGTEIKTLPDSVNKLSNLQTLVVTNLKKLPNTIVDLRNLRHLYISKIELPPLVRKLTTLQTLPYYVVGHNNGCKIDELENLTNLKGELGIWSLEKVKDKEEAMRANLFGKSGILKLVLNWSSTREGDMNDENVLEGLQPHPNLKSFKIYGYGSIHFPPWTMKMTVYKVIECCWESLANLINVSIEDCQCKQVPNLGHLPHLKFLKLEKLPGVQSIGPSFYGLEDCNTIATIDDANTPPVFRALEKLWLLEMENLTEWVNVESRAATFPCLEYLEIDSCPYLESAPTRFPRLKELTLWSIGSNFPLPKMCASTSSLQRLSISSYSGIINIGDECFVKNRDLSYWRIDLCPNMMYIEQDSRTPHGLTSLTRLYITRCPRLKSIPNFDLKSLQNLEISECESFTCLPHDLLESCIPTLETLVLSFLPELENINSVLPCIPRMLRLQELSLYDLPKLTNLPMEIPKLTNLPMEIPKLWDLEFGGFSELIDADSFNDCLKHILHTSHHLEYLEIYGNEDWRYLPDLIQHCHALISLYVVNFGIEDLPEWIGNLSSLTVLSVTDCKRLCNLPSKETMRRTSLHRLSIDNCPLLKEKFRTQQESTPGGSELSKISHIKDVYIDGESLSTYNTVQYKKFAGCIPIPQKWKHRFSDYDT